MAIPKTPTATQATTITAIQIEDSVNEWVFHTCLKQPSISILNSPSSRVINDSNLFLLMVNLYLIIFKAWWTLNECMFYHFTIFWTVVNLDLKYQLGESSPNYINAVMNLYLLVKEKRWTDDECWSNDFYEKVNRGEDLRRVSSRCQLMAAWYKHNTCLVIFS